MLFRLLALTAAALLALGPVRAAAADQRPNILLIILDDWSWNHAGVYGSTWVQTPNFDRVAREGVLFTHAFTSNPKCSPMRASLLTGRNTWQLESGAMHMNHWPKNYTAVYPKLLEQAGYFVGLTGKGWGPGNFAVAGFEHNPAGPLFEFHRTPPPARGIHSKDYTKNFETFLEQWPKDRPFLFWMGIHEPHRVYEAGSGLRLGKRLEDVVVPGYFPDAEVIRSDLLDYAVEVEHGDAHIGGALKALERIGQLDNTLVLVTSDHGMPFPFVKGQIKEDGFRLPLAVRWPSTVEPGRVVEDFINVRDIAPTFMEAAGLRPHSDMTGRSFLNLLRSTGSGWIEPDRDIMLIGKERHDLGRPNDWGYPVRAIRTREYLYVRNYHPERYPAGDPLADYPNTDASPTKELLKAIGGYYYELSFGKRPADELYRLSDDPETVYNLAHDPYYEPLMAQLREKMMRILRDEGDPRALGQGRVFETYDWMGPRHRSYPPFLEEAIQRALPSP